MHKLNHSSDCRKLLLAIAGIAAAAVPMITGRMSALAQTQTASTPVLSFEIASIKAENGVPFPRPPQTPSPARRYENAFMKAETVSDMPSPA